MSALKTTGKKQAAAKFTKGQSGNPSGRPKGVPNKATKALKDMILGALDQAGGETYLATQATKNPAAFMTLIGKVLPMQVTGAGDGENPLRIVIEYAGERG